MNNQQNEPTFYQKNRWWIWILTGLLVMALFFRNLNFKNPFFNEDGKREEAIVTAIKNSTKEIVGAVKDNGKKIDQLGDKVDKNTEVNKVGFHQVADSVSSLKKSCLTCQQRVHKNPNKPKVTKKPCQPTKPNPCCKEKPQPEPCPYDAIIDGEKYIYYNGKIPDTDDEKRKMRLKAGPRGSKDEGRWFIPGERTY